MSTELAQTLRGRLAILLDQEPAEIGDEDSFSDLGVDSMMRLELVALVEQNMGRELPEQEVLGLTNIQEVVRYVAERQPAAS